MAIGLGPGKGKKKNDQPKSKIGGGIGKTTVAPGYKMGLIRNERDTKTPTKKITTGTGPTAVTRVQQQGIIGPIKSGSGSNFTTAPAKKKGPSAVGKAISKAKNSIELAARRRVATSAYRGGGGGGRRGGGKTCAAYR
jgi:hypothetical protein